MAKEHDFTFLDNRSDVKRFVEAGYLVRVSESRDVELHTVSFPYARPEVKLFIERLGAQYRRACGERLVVTSLLRPRQYQPRNASPRSVHPTGIALDLRRSNNRRCRSWLERTLLTLEGRGVLEASHERRPPHYHLALGPNQYVGYLLRRGISIPHLDRHQVVRGESLWKIARQYGTTVEGLKRINDLRGNTVYPGQVLQVRAR